MTQSGHRAGGYPFFSFGCTLMNHRVGGPPCFRIQSAYRDLDSLLKNNNSNY
jgi:hypothetical protein